MAGAEKYAQWIVKNADKKGKGGLIFTQEKRNLRNRC